MDLTQTKGIDNMDTKETKEMLQLAVDALFEARDGYEYADKDYIATVESTLDYIHFTCQHIDRLEKEVNKK